MIRPEQAEELLAELVRTARTFRHARRTEGRENLSGTKYMALRCLTGGDRRLTALADEIGVSPAVASRTVDSLELEGLITRRADSEDARAILLSVTAAGRDTLVRSRERIVSRFAAALDRWEPDDATRAGLVLARLNESLERALEIEQPVTGIPSSDAAT